MANDWCPHLISHGTNHSNFPGAKKPQRPSEILAARRAFSTVACCFLTQRDWRATRRMHPKAP